VLDTCDDGSDMVSDLSPVGSAVMSWARRTAIRSAPLKHLCRLRSTNIKPWTLVMTAGAAAGGRSG